MLTVVLKGTKFYFCINIDYIEFKISSSLKQKHFDNDYQTFWRRKFSSKRGSSDWKCLPASKNIETREKIHFIHKLFFLADRFE